MKNNTKNIEDLDFCSTSRPVLLKKLKETEFDILIIGGGATGAAIARDATLRGFNVALVDKNDFAFGTSSRSSKMAHGGFRYLKSLEFGLVREAEAERNWLRRDFPNLVRPLPVIAPVYEGEKYPLWLLWLGVSLYNILDGYKNYKKGILIRNPERIKGYETIVNMNGLKGFGVIYDTNIDDARLTIETIKEAVYSGRCVAVNYVKITRISKDPHTGKCDGALAKDQETNDDEFLIKAKIVISATGIWTDELLTKPPKGYPNKIIRPTKGVHLVFKKRDVPINNAFGIISHIDGRFFFVLDRDNFTIIGTTDTDYNDNLDEPFCTKEDAEYLLSTVKLKFPDANVSLDKMIGTFAGIRPLARPKAKKGQEIDESTVSRKHEIIKCEDDLLIICGGKLTTFRVMAEDLMQKYVFNLAKRKMINKKFKKRKNIAKKRYLISMTREEWNSHPLVREFKDNNWLDEYQLNFIYQQYGKGGLNVLDIAKSETALREQIISNDDVQYCPWILAEVKYVVLHDLPLHLVDILARRMEIAYEVHPSDQPLVARKTADVAGQILGWDDKRKTFEIKAYIEYVKLNSFFYNKDLS
ncbi:MAG: glycerol-3-phosphate dehydrogenase/oxidase [Promethearchaeota archaeon]